MLNFPNLSRLPETLATSPYRRPAFFALVAVGIMCAIGYFLGDPMLYNSPHGWYIYAPSAFIFQWRAFAHGLVAALLQGVLLFCALRFALLDKDFWEEGKGKYAAIFGLATPGLVFAVASLLGWLNPGHINLAGTLFLEELAKSLVFVVLVLAHQRVITRFGWLIGYALVVGLGFASVENIKYYSEAFSGAWYWCGNNTLDACTANMLIGRGLLSPFMHSFFSVIIAIGLWWATHRAWMHIGQEKSAFWAYVLWAFFVAYCIHIHWDAYCGNPLVLYIEGLTTTLLVIIFTYFESKKGLSPLLENWFVEQIPRLKRKDIQQDERALRNQLAVKSALKRIFSWFTRK
jgi:hypothetical protein